MQASKEQRGQVRRSGSEGGGGEEGEGAGRWRPARKLGFQESKRALLGLLPRQSFWGLDQLTPILAGPGGDGPSPYDCRRVVSGSHILCRAARAALVCWNSGTGRPGDGG